MVLKRRKLRASEYFDFRPSINLFSHNDVTYLIEHVLRPGDFFQRSRVIDILHLIRKEKIHVSNTYIYSFHYISHRQTSFIKYLSPAAVAT